MLLQQHICFASIKCDSIFINTKNVVNKRAFGYASKDSTKQSDTSYIDYSDIVAIFMNDIKNFRLLTREEELKLIKEYQTTENKKLKIEIRNQIITSNLGIVIKIAREYAGRNTRNDLLDLIQEGTFGIMKALDEFDMSKLIHGNFITYASFHIKNSIRYICADRTIVRVSKSKKGQSAFIYKMGKKIALIDSFDSESDDMVSQYNANKPIQSFLILNKELILKYGDQSLDQTFHKDCVDSCALLDTIGSDQQTQEDILMQKELVGTVGYIIETIKPTLNKIELDILTYHLVLSKEESAYISMYDMAEKHKCSYQNIYQQKSFLIKKLKHAFQMHLNEHVVLAVNKIKSNLNHAELDILHNRILFYRLQTYAELSKNHKVSVRSILRLEGKMYDDLRAIIMEMDGEYEILEDIF